MTHRPLTSSQLASVLALLLAQGTTACALTSKSEPVVPRYFDLDQNSPTSSGAEFPSRPARRLRLGQIEAAEHLDERLVFRSSTREIGYYEGQRWSEQPREYLRRALARELYERRGLVRVLGGSAPTLEVELSSFEEVRANPEVARVRLTYVLHDDRSVLLERTITIEREVTRGASSKQADAVVLAMAEAMHLAVREIARSVADALPQPTSPIKPSPCPEAAQTEVRGSE
jgi:ABC-type uncharacterized transport system auxiliary subunit